jgi:hypothetical protein
MTINNGEAIISKERVDDLDINQIQQQSKYNNT